MAKPEMVCPFSKKVCIECAQFRGRHYYICFSPNHRGCSPKKPTPVTKMLHPRGVMRLPAVSVSEKCLKNIEDSCERSEE